MEAPSSTYSLPNDETVVLDFVSDISDVWQVGASGMFSFTVNQKRHVYPDRAVARAGIYDHDYVVTVHRKFIAAINQWRTWKALQ